MQADQIGHNADHVGQVQEGLVDQGHALVENLLGAGDEFGVSLEVGGAALRDLAQHQLVTGAEIEWLVVVIEDTVEGITGDELKIVLTATAGSLPYLVEDPGRGDHGGTAVKSEAVNVLNVGAAAQLVALCERVQLMAARGQAGGGAQSTEAGADNDDSRQS